MESSHHSANNLLESAHVDILASHSNFKIPITLVDQNEHFKENKLYHVYQREKKTQQNREAQVEKLKKMLKNVAPYRPPTLLLCVYRAGLLWLPVLHTLHF